MGDVFVKVDGVGLNATHYTKLKKEDAIVRMKEDGVQGAENATWAANAYDLCKKTLQDMADKAAEEAKKAAKKKVA